MTGEPLDADRLRACPGYRLMQGMVGLNEGLVSALELAPRPPRAAVQRASDQPHGATTDKSTTP